MPSREITKSCVACGGDFKTTQHKQVYCSIGCSNTGRQKSPLVRLLANIEVQPNGCWWWMLALEQDGYGKFSIKDQAIPAHRAAYELLVGPIPKEHTIDHQCHDPKVCQLGKACPHRRCVNPDHLKPMSNVDNIRRGGAGIIAGERQKAKTQCPRGHEYTPENTYRDKKNRRYCKQCSRLRRSSPEEYGRLRAVCQQ